MVITHSVMRLRNNVKLWSVGAGEIERILNSFLTKVINLAPMHMHAMHTHTDMHSHTQRIYINKATIHIDMITTEICFCYSGFFIIQVNLKY